MSTGFVAPGGRGRGRSQVIFAATGKKAGSVHQGVFTKTIDEDRHLLRYPVPAIAFGLEVLEAIERAGGHSCRVTVKRGNQRKVYFASLAVIRAKGFPVNRAGWGPQWALALEYWTQTGPGAPGQPRLL